MISRLRAWWWRRLGGHVDAEGLLLPDEDDPVIVFRGIAERARPVKERLEAAGFEVTANALVADPRPAANQYGVSPRPSEVALEVRAADADRARVVVEG